jgi:4-amino-4-deoxy-L-arabinose transferase-like glycosyltransferase
VSARRFALTPSAAAVAGVFVAALALLFLLRGEALATPYFWDEVGYYVPNAVSMYENHLYPIPETTVPQSYPPLHPLLIVVGWWLLGFSIAATRVVGFVVAAATVAAVYALGRELASPAVGVAAAAFTLASPVLFGQTGFAQPELLLAFFTVTATHALVRGRMGWHALAVAGLLMTKWTAIVSLPAFGLYALATAPTWRKGIARQLWYALALAPLGAWLAFFYSKTGTLTSTDARYAKVNLWDNLVPEVLAFRWAVRVEQLVENDLAWLVLGPALLAGAYWLWRRAHEEEPDDPVHLRELSFLLLAAQCVAYAGFLTISGFLLPRYFVPVWPLVAVLGAAGLFALLPRPVAAGYAAAAALAMHLCWYGWFPGFYPALLDARIDYVRLIHTHMAAASFVERNYPSARVAAAWPALDEIRTPYFGYVTRPLETVAIDALPPGEAARGAFDLVFDSPIRQNPNPARELATRLGLVEIARFEEGDQETVLWADPRRIPAN